MKHIEPPRSSSGKREKMNVPEALENERSLQ
jgi:hypothetical protein